MENIKLNSSLRVTFILTFRTVITIIIISSVKVFVIENANLIPRPLNSALLQQRAISQSRTFEWFLIQPCHPPRSLITVCHQCHRHHRHHHHHYHHRHHLIELILWRNPTWCVIHSRCWSYWHRSVECNDGWMMCQFAGDHTFDNMPLLHWLISAWWLIIDRTVQHIIVLHMLHMYK